jgi:hypothetical protein
MLRCQPPSSPALIRWSSTSDSPWQWRRWPRCWSDDSSGGGGGDGRHHRNRNSGSGNGGVGNGNGGTTTLTTG